MTDTTHSLTQTHPGQWLLRSHPRHDTTKPLTTIHATHPETAMTRANTWLATRNIRRGTRWAKSRGYTHRWVLRT